MRKETKDTLSLKEVVDGLNQSIKNHLTDIRIADLDDEELARKEEKISLLLMNWKDKHDKLATVQIGRYPYHRSTIEANQDDLYDLIDSV